MQNKTPIENIRSNIQTLAAEKLKLQFEVNGREKLREYLTTCVRHWVDAGAHKHVSDMRLYACGAPVEFLTVTAMTHQGPVKVDVGPMFAHLLGEEHLLSALQAGIEAIPEGLTATERTERIASIDTDLHTLQVSEERLIRESESNGRDIARRVDADPAYVLAM